MKILPEGVEAVAVKSPLTVDDTERTALIAKAKELLTEPTEMSRLIEVLEHWCVYGLELEGSPSGTYVKAEGHESKHYTSKQLMDIIKQVQTDLAPVVEENPIIEK